MSVLMDLQYRPTGADDSQDELRPNVLVITSELPWPLNTGGHLRTYHLLKSLAAECDVRLVTAVESADDPGIAVLEEAGLKVRAAVTGERNQAGEAWRALRKLVRGEPYVMFHRHNRRAIDSAIRQELAEETPDLVYLDHLDPLVYRPLFAESRMVADLHNVYSKLAARVADERVWPVSLYLRHEAKLLRDMERRVAAEADTLMVVSDEERGEFQSLGGRRVRLVPNGVDCSLYRHLPVGRDHQQPVLLYLGALSWQPNAKAAEFLARDVMPHVLRKHPHARLQIVGRNPGPDVEQLKRLPGVELHANVPDVGVYLEQSTLLAVPLDSGGGTRLKILEAFAAGLPVVSTPIGCEGIDCVSGQHLWVAERDRFAEAILDNLEAPALAHEYAERGRQLAEEKYDWSVIGKLACSAVKEAVRGNS